MTTLRILVWSAVMGLVAWCPISLAPADWHGWILLGLVLVLRHRLAELHHRLWLERAERLEAEQEREPLPIPRPHLGTGLVERDSHVHVLRPNPKDDESIRRA